MRAIRGLAILFCTALLVILAAPSAQADQWNKKTVVTVSEAVEIPGMILEPGTYIFQLADSQSNRHIVQIWTEDGQRLITTVMAVPAYRQEVTGDSVIYLDERPADSPMAIRTWFYPGDNTGQEFVYDYRYNVESPDEATSDYNR